MIDGIDIRDYTIAGLRQHIGFVLQDTALFRGTVAENIAYGKPDATRDQIIHAAELANAQEFIEQMPEGFDTMVGDRGLRCPAASGSGSASRAPSSATRRS